MTVFVALVRAMNVGGTGVMSMATLRAICAECGLHDARTYLQSGNVLFASRCAEPQLRRTLEDALGAKSGKPVSVLIRTAAELRATIVGNPFTGAKPSQVGIVFLARPVPGDVLTKLTMPGREELRPAGREIFVHYPDGMGRSKLKIPFASEGTMRNLNTVTKLAALASFTG